MEKWVYLLLGIPVGVAVAMLAVVMVDEWEFRRRWGR